MWHSLEYVRPSVEQILLSASITVGQWVGQTQTPSSQRAPLSQCTLLHKSGCYEPSRDDRVQVNLRAMVKKNDKPQSPGDATTINCCLVQAADLSSHSFRYVFPSVPQISLAANCSKETIYSTLNELRRRWDDVYTLEQFLGQTHSGRPISSISQLA